MRDFVGMKIKGGAGRGVLAREGLRLLLEALTSGSEHAFVLQEDILMSEDEIKGLINTKYEEWS